MNRSRVIPTTVPRARPRYEVETPAAGTDQRDVAQHHGDADQEQRHEQRGRPVLGAVDSGKAGADDGVQLRHRRLVEDPARPGTWIGLLESRDEVVESPGRRRARSPVAHRRPLVVYDGIGCRRRPPLHPKRVARREAARVADELAEPRGLVSRVVNGLDIELELDHDRER